jgi:hypothetical protein
MSALGANFVSFVVITALATSPMLIFLAYTYATVEPTLSSLASFQTTALIAAVAEMALAFIAQAAVVYGTVEHLAGRKVSTGASLARGLSMVGPVLGVALATTLLVAIGLVALLVPGLILMCMYFVAVPSAVIERIGIGEAMRRSAELTKGYRWHIFGAALVIGLMENIVTRVLSSVFISGNSIEAIVSGLKTFGYVTLVLSIFFGAFRAVLSAVAYSKLRRSREGVDAQELARIFE